MIRSNDCDHSIFILILTAFVVLDSDFYNDIKIIQLIEGIDLTRSYGDFGNIFLCFELYEDLSDRSPALSRVELLRLCLLELAQSYFVVLRY